MRKNKFASLILTALLLASLVGLHVESGITITPPAKSPFEDASWPVIFKFQTE